AGSKDRPPMLAPGNYVQWKSRIKRCIDTKPIHDLIHHCLKNPPYKFSWVDKEVPISKGISVTQPIIRASQDNSPRINRSTGYENQRMCNVAGARETVGSTMIIMANVPPNDPNVDALAIVPALVNPDHAPAQPVLQNRQKSKGSFPLPLGLQVREPPAEPSSRPVPDPYPNDPYVVTRDAAVADAAIATSGINDDDDDTAPMDSQPHEPSGSPHFMKCSPITFRRNKGAVDRALTWWNSHVATLGIEVVNRKTWAEMKVMMTEEFCPPEEIQRMEENIKGEVTSSEPATLNKAMRMAHTLME
nr:hypothetical protein [Tanacetum cinerariifolium]